MIDSNQQTIQAYEAHVKEYMEGTPQDVSDAEKEWFSRMLSVLPKNASILEIGSATGRDAAYVESLGYTVEPSDATRAFVRLLTQAGHTARLLNILTDELTGPYDLIFAKAVLLHFTPSEVSQVIRKVWAALAPRGRFAFTVKEGVGEAWSAEKLGVPRYYCYWTMEAIEKVVRDAGFTKTQLAGDRVNAKTSWVQVIASKE